MKEVFGKSPITSSQFPVLLWDASGCLFHFQPTLERFYAESLRARGIDTSLDQIEKIWVEILQELNRDVEHNENFSFDRLYFLRKILDRFPIETDKKQQLLLSINDDFHSMVKIVIPQLNVLFCAELKNRGYRLGIVSNWDHRLSEILRMQGVLDLFEVVICGTQMLKPAPEIFQEALDDMDVPASKAIYIGESYAIDVVGAQRAGMKAILYDPTYREMRALAENTAESLSKVVSIDVLRQNRRLQGVKVVTKLEELDQFIV